jgi:hypothetical protein
MYTCMPLGGKFVLSREEDESEEVFLQHFIWMHEGMEACRLAIGIPTWRSRGLETWRLAAGMVTWRYGR